jgi:protein-tyrosine phosphatase
MESGVRRDTMQLVERAIAVARRRRSIKAVETYEQVKFLVDFVEYLRETPMTSDEL